MRVHTLIQAHTCRHMHTHKTDAGVHTYTGTHTAHTHTDAGAHKHTRAQSGTAFQALPTTPAPTCLNPTILNPSPLKALACCPTPDPEPGPHPNPDVCAPPSDSHRGDRLDKLPVRRSPFSPSTRVTPHTAPAAASQVHLQLQVHGSQRGPTVRGASGHADVVLEVGGGV